MVSGLIPATSDLYRATHPRLARQVMFGDTSYEILKPPSTTCPCRAKRRHFRLGLMLTVDRTSPRGCMAHYSFCAITPACPNRACAPCRLSLPIRKLGFTLVGEVKGMSIALANYECVLYSTFHALSHQGRCLHAGYKHR